MDGLRKVDSLPSHPRAARQVFVQVCRGQLRLGPHHSGIPRARVQCLPGDPRLELPESAGKGTSSSFGAVFTEGKCMEEGSKLGDNSQETARKAAICYPQERKEGERWAGHE